MITCTFENGGNASLRHVVVHAIVEKDDALLLVKRSKKLSLEGGKWALPGGFLDRDETASQCTLRELKEETGWEGTIGDLLLIKTNPDRPHEDRQNVAFNFVVHPVKQSGVPDKETSDVAWIPINKLPPLDDLAFDHGEATGLYLKHRKSPIAIPVVV